MCVAEWITQTLVVFFSYLPVYTFLLVALVLVVQLFGVPWDW